MGLFLRHSVIVCTSCILFNVPGKESCTKPDRDSRLDERIASLTSRAGVRASVKSTAGVDSAAGRRCRSSKCITPKWGSAPIRLTLRPAAKRLGPLQTDRWAALQTDRSAGLMGGWDLCDEMDLVESVIRGRGAVTSWVRPFPRVVSAAVLDRA
jgi:hypothetical protein